MLNLFVQQIKKQRQKQGINHGEHNQGKQHLIGGHRFRQSIGSAQQAIHHPGLTAHFGGKPAGLVGNLGRQNRKYKHPKQPALVKKFAPVPLPAGKQRQGNEEHANRYHEVVKLKNGIDCRRAVGFREGVQPRHGRFEILVQQIRQAARDF